MPLFICGGGSNVHVYIQVINQIEEWAKNYIGELIENRKENFKGFHRIKLEKPDTLDSDIEEGLFHRFAVAWGLSFEPYNIGEYIEVPTSQDIDE